MKAKKIFKGMTAAAIAAVLTASMVPMTAFAATITDAAQTITFAQNVQDESESSKLTYDIYQVATAEVAAGGTAYNYTLASGLTNIDNPFYVPSSTDLQTRDEYITIDTIANTLSTNASDMKKLADALSGAVVTKLESVQAGGTKDLAPGYYLIKTSGSQMTGAPILLSVRSDMVNKTVNAKTSEVTFSKTIESITAGATGTGITGGTVASDKDTAQVSIGSTVSYTITTKIPQYDSQLKAAVLAGTVDLNDYVITDRPSVGLTMDQNNIVYNVGGTEIEENVTTDSKGAIAIQQAQPSIGTGESAGFRATFSDAFVVDHAGEIVTITYTATVNNSAVVGTVGNPNNANLHFDNNYYAGGGNKDIPDESKVFTTKLVVNKTFSDNPTSGSYPIAGFTLYKGTDASGTKIFNDVRTTADNNSIEFTGLAAGDYYLVESTTPDGYKTANPVSIKITANGEAKFNGTYTFDGAQTGPEVSNSYGTVPVVNIAGQTLPGTGGVGTTIFTIFGVGVVLAAGVMLVVYMRKRRTEDEE